MPAEAHEGNSPKTAGLRTAAFVRGTSQSSRVSANLTHFRMPLILVPDRDSHRTAAEASFVLRRRYHPASAHAGAFLASSGLALAAELGHPRIALEDQHRAVLFREDPGRLNRLRATAQRTVKEPGKRDLVQLKPDVGFQELYHPLEACLCLFAHACELRAFGNPSQESSKPVPIGRIHRDRSILWNSATG